MKPSRSILWFIVSTELRLFFHQQHTLRIVPLALLSTVLSLWPYIGSVFVPPCIAVFVGLEAQYNDVFFRTPGEIRAMTLFSLRWKEVILAKNIATVILTLLTFGLFSLLALYAAPRIPSNQEAVLAILYLVSVMVPMLSVGNLRSLQDPRPSVGWGLSDLAEGLLMLVTTGVLSIPFLVSVLAMEEPLVCVVWIAVASALWLRLSVPGTARRLFHDRIRLCQIE